MPRQSDSDVGIDSFLYEVKFAVPSLVAGDREKQQYSFEETRGLAPRGNRFREKWAN
jgi:hypothetical protein